jgi:uncharacterized membrane protein
MCFAWYRRLADKAFNGHSAGGQAMRKLLLALLCGLLWSTVSPPKAEAALKLCNYTGSRVGVAVGYKDPKGWASEGWWTIEAQKCSVIVNGALIARYYYIYAVDYEKGGSWGGKSNLCISGKIFTIRGFENCVSRGYQSVGFFEVDTVEESDWTVKLSGEKTSQPTQ